MDPGNERPADGKNAYDSLPMYWRHAWLRDEWIDDHGIKDIIQNHTVSSLCKQYLEYQFDKFDRQTSEAGTYGAPSLTSISVNRALQLLRASHDLTADLDTLLKTLDFNTVKKVIADERTPYMLTRAYSSRFGSDVREDEASSILDMVDVDEAVIVHERYLERLTREGSDTTDFLVTQDDLLRVISDYQAFDDTKPLQFRRKDPPPGGLEILADCRERKIQIMSTIGMFKQVLDFDADDVLAGMDWNNVLQVGRLVLTSLVPPDPVIYGNKFPRQNTIELFLYGLPASEASEKLQHIYTVWYTNSRVAGDQSEAQGASDDGEHTVVRDTHMIELNCTAPPRRTIRIHLRLYASPTQIMQNVLLDSHAIGYDGNKVIMLPRCARAIETGYSVHTLSRMWQSNFSDRREVYGHQIFHDSILGFGIRLLPSYVRSLETHQRHDLLRAAAVDKIYSKDNIETQISISNGRADSHTPSWNFRTKDDDPAEYESLEDYRRPQGAEPGFKTVQRINFLGADFVNRFIYGPTPLNRETVSMVTLPYHLDEWRPDYAGRKRLWEVFESERDYKIIHGLPLEVPIVDFDGFRTESDPACTMADENDAGVSSLEQLLRSCHAWSLVYKEAVTIVRVNRGTFQEGDVNLHEWDNENLSPVHAICHKLGIALQRRGYRGYLSRKILCVLWSDRYDGNDIRNVTKKDITLPLTIPADLENYIEHEIPSRFPELSQSFPGYPHLMKVHDPSTQSDYTGPLPSLAESPNETGNLRYWLKNTSSMWAGQHHALEYIEHIYTVLSQIFSMRSLGSSAADASGSDFKLLVAKHLGRFVDPPSDIGQDRNGATATSASTSSDLLRFQAWALADPKISNRFRDLFPWKECLRNTKIEEKNYIYPVPDELFWPEDDANLHSRQADGDVQPWRDVPVEEDAKYAWRTNVRRKLDRDDDTNDEDGYGSDAIGKGGLEFMTATFKVASPDEIAKKRSEEVAESDGMTEDEVPNGDHDVTGDEEVADLSGGV
ncbi:hypothetical protein MMC25_006245 [Agyrium rufum]|nr:hypothetical protein [Agyrium rufum]